MRFDHFYANSPVCSPTRAALLSGRYPDMVGVPGVIRTHAEDSWGYLDPQAPLLPQALQGAGYHTALVGKWHLGTHPRSRPQHRGFDLFHGFLGDMMDDYVTHRRWGINYMRRNDQVVEPAGHATDVFTGWAVDYVRERGKTEAPFFLYLAYNAPHTPIQPPDSWVEKVRRREPGITEKRARLVALIEHMDEGIGQVVAALKESGVYDNTLIVFTSDNGGQLSAGARNGSLRDGKGSMYEGGIRVPMGVVWPGRVAPGSRSDEIGLTMDLYTTLVEVAGVEVTHWTEGRSLLPLWLRQQDSLAPRTLVWMRREGGDTYMGQVVWAIRRGPWKLLQNRPMQPFELYNLERDPREQADLAATETARFGELAAALRAHVARSGAVPWQHR